MRDLLSTSPQPQDPLADVLTNSRIKVARACLREHHYRYTLGIRPAQDADELRFGSLMHLALEQWFLATQQGVLGDERLNRALAALEVEKDPFDRARAEVLMIGYDARWADEPLEILAVERVFTGPMVNPETGASSRTWRRGGRLDVVWRDLRDGLRRVTDHKTSGEDIRQGSEFWRRTRMDSQISTYFEGARQLGYDVVGWVHDVIAKPGLRPLKATPVEDRKYTKPTAKEPVSRLYANQRETDETPAEFRMRLAEAVQAEPEAFYQRAEIVRLENELKEAMLDDWQFGQYLRDSVRTGIAPRNPDACRRFGRTCSFFDVCSGTASIDDPFRFKRVDVVHPELTEVAR